MDNVHMLDPHARMTVEEALAYAAKEDLKDVLIIGYDQNDDLVVRSSAMNCKDALWMLEKAKHYTLNPDE